MSFDWIKLQAVEFHISIKETSARAGYEVNQFYKIINGFQAAPVDFEAKVRRVFSEIQQRQAVSYGCQTRPTM